MTIEIELTQEPIPEKLLPPSAGAQGAWLEFRGVVRDEEDGRKISALEYEAYPEMAKREMGRLLGDISTRHPCLAAKIIHRLGSIPIGATAIYAGIASSHRAEAIALIAEFMDKLKQDVPIWKRRAFPLAATANPTVSAAAESHLNVGLRTNAVPSPLPHLHRSFSEGGSDMRGEGQGEVRGTGSRTATTLDDALAKISSHCAALAATPVPLEECFGHILRETVCAPTDFPDCDRSTRDGYAILENDTSERFHVVGTLHAADWQPRQLKLGEAIRIATGACMPSPNLRVVMRENVEQNGDKIRIAKAGPDLNIRRRGEEIRAGDVLVPAGNCLDAGDLALLASAGCVRPLASPRLRIFHFTTGDEVVPPDHAPKPGQIRDSNSILIRGLLQSFPCNLTHDHLREDFEMATAQIKNRRQEMEQANVLLISGGASVGDKDFTRPLLESLGFQIVFGKVAIRPGRPAIFAVNGRRIAFGLPGNPLAHFVCFHLFVAPALARLSGGEMKRFLQGKLAEPLEEASNERETVWPARLNFDNGEARLHPLPWSSSGDLTCLTWANALLRVPPNCGRLEAGAQLDFLPAWQGPRAWQVALPPPSPPAKRGEISR